jgi:hypothetical protein
MVSFLGLSDTACALIIAAAAAINFLNACVVARYARRKGHVETDCGTALFFFIAFCFGTLHLIMHPLPLPPNRVHLLPLEGPLFIHSHFSGLFSWVIFCCDSDSQPGVNVNGVRVINVPAQVNYHPQVRSALRKTSLVSSSPLPLPSTRSMSPHPLSCSNLATATTSSSTIKRSTACRGSAACLTLRLRLHMPPPLCTPPTTCSSRHRRLKRASASRSTAASCRLLRPPWTDTRPAYRWDCYHCRHE